MLRPLADCVGLTPEGRVEVEETALPPAGALTSLRGSKEKG